MHTLPTQPASHDPCIALDRLFSLSHASPTKCEFQAPPNSVLCITQKVKNGKLFPQKYHSIRFFSTNDAGFVRVTLLCYAVEAQPHPGRADAFYIQIYRLRS